MSLVRTIEKIARANYSDIQKERYDTCKKCKFFNETFRTCGKPYTGSEVTYRRKKYKTCGCVMPLKTWLPFFSCPLGKWLQVEGWGLEFIDEVKKVLSDYEHKPSKDNLKAVYAVYKKLLGEAGKDINPNDLSCNLCKNNRINELKDFVRRSENC